MRGFSRVIKEEITKLEKINFQNLQSDIMDAIVLMQFHDQHFTAWGMTMESFRNGQKVIEKQRFQYPSDWLSISQVE